MNFSTCGSASTQRRHTSANVHVIQRSPQVGSGRPARTFGSIFLYITADQLG